MIAGLLGKMDVRPLGRRTSAAFRSAISCVVVQTTKRGFVRDARAPRSVQPCVVGCAGSAALVAPDLCQGPLVNVPGAIRLDIAIAVVLENQGEGSDYAAPVFRAIVETYYFGEPRARPWFGPLGGPLYTPTPLVTETPEE